MSAFDDIKWSDDEEYENCCFARYFTLSIRTINVAFAPGFKHKVSFNFIF